ncbi:MAG: AraC family transcriptional regulator [Clostridiales bacterium]|jgi:AraC-like DNA-binding protein|nr:AraC family transcriptional regulator [Clostridiales bacterium]
MESMERSISAPAHPIIPPDPNSFNFLLYKRSVTDGYANLYPAWHNEYEIIFMEFGCAEFNADGEEILLEAGNALLISPGAIHSCCELKRGTFSYTSLLFAESFIFPDQKDMAYQKYILPLHTARKRLPAFIAPSAKCGSQALALIKEAIACEQSKQFGYELELKIKLLSLFNLFLKENALEDAPVRKSGIESRIKESIAFMHDNFQKELKISEIAESLHICTEYFIRSFKALVGKTPKEYLIEYRLNHVLSLMLTEDGTITSMATRCGFDDMCYFSRCFKKNFGISAQVFKKSYSDIDAYERLKA